MTAPFYSSSLRNLNKIKRSIPISTKHRKKFCLAHQKLNKHADQFTTYRILRHYKKKQMIRVMDNVRALHKDSLLAPFPTKKKKITYLTFYCLHMPKHNSISRKYDCILKRNKHLKKYFSCKANCYLPENFSSQRYLYLINSNLKSILPEPRIPNRFYHCKSHNHSLLFGKVYYILCTLY